MVDNPLKMSERTAIIAGPVTGYFTSLAMELSEHGADVALVSPDIRSSQRFADEIMNRREINPKFGRAYAIESKIDSANAAKEAVQKAAQTFGGIDIYIDSHFVLRSEDRRSPKDFLQADSLDDLDEYITANLKAPMYLTHSILPMFEKRERGKVIFLTSALSRKGLSSDVLNSCTRVGVEAFAASLARRNKCQHISINCVEIGPTEESVLAAFPESSSAAEGLAKLQEFFPGVKLCEPIQIAKALAFLSSSMSQGISGQTIRIEQGILN